MDRRAFIGTLTGGLLTAPLAAEAQPAGRMPRIGVLLPAEPASPTEPNASAFRQGLRDLGYVEGQTITVEYRYAHGRTDRYAELVGELVQLKVDILVAGGNASYAARDATRTIPIVSIASWYRSRGELRPTRRKPYGIVGGVRRRD